ncbi:hypothetical protein FIBSPDRAFT_942275, partial [Athelia psychrophila]
MPAPLTPPPPTVHEMERFDASPLEFSGQGAADVLQALVGSGYEAVATGIAGTGLGGAPGVPWKKFMAGNGWKMKDSSVYLMTAVTTCRGMAQLSCLAMCCSGSGRISEGI